MRSATPQRNETTSEWFMAYRTLRAGPEPPLQDDRRGPCGPATHASAAEPSDRRSDVCGFRLLNLGNFSNHWNAHTKALAHDDRLAILQSGQRRNHVGTHVVGQEVATRLV